MARDSVVLYHMFHSGVSLTLFLTQVPQSMWLLCFFCAVKSTPFCVVFLGFRSIYIQRVFGKILSLSISTLPKNFQEVIASQFLYQISGSSIPYLKIL